MSEATYCLNDLPQHVQAKITIHPVSGCWILPRTAGSKMGYARISINGIRDWAHRRVYQVLVGPIPADHDIDHVKARGCIDNACCWPVHLEPVTRAENLRRGRHANREKTQCPEGHALVAGNLVHKTYGRECLICHRAYHREYQRQYTAPQRETRQQELNTRSAEAARLRAEGLSLREIGLQLGISKRTAGRILRTAEPGQEA